jgi:hypothetical protein
MDFVFHVGGPAFLGLIGGGIIGATHYYATKPMSVKEPDPETGIRNTTLLSYHPTVMGSLHDLVTYRAASLPAVLKMRDTLEEIEAINVYSATAPIRKLRLNMITAMRDLSAVVKDTLVEQYEKTKYVTNEHGEPHDPFLLGIHRAIFEFLDNSLKNLETTLNERMNAEIIGEEFIQGVHAIQKAQM